MTTPYKKVWRTPPSQGEFAYIDMLPKVTHLNMSSTYQEELQFLLDNSQTYLFINVQWLELLPQPSHLLSWQGRYISTSYRMCLGAVTP